ncbi:GntR family transcriptional regulator [Amycolatopsis acidiphila]|uniref:GntR family transcriptional regulator n=1 Tax=Amycolatopsis acidiphila TaxID=715473 RepID=A0A558AP95_9PSEU|nr:GntR family transcriptional regulator [Amycolatopsis acidiphila]TVT26075.1 GntR family transcriptional regulator [Amycolatopsis acidiphila]UIJ63199.1 GntR family transcriptional regulator [Amycolatopsis acidiphila]GHG74298.1 transcriptional regulator [Amycolatopsis acidiphila]
MTGRTGVPAAVASQRIAEEIREQILNGTLPPGTRIIQDELAEQLRTSRLPVREALRILQSRGLVTLRSNQGAWVTSMDMRECELSYKIRERVEPLLLAESAPRLSDDDIAGLARLQDRIEQAPGVEEFLVLDRELHWATYRHHQAEELASIVARLWDTTQHYRRAFTRLTGERRRWIIGSEHRLLIEALRDRDHTSAERILELHIRRTRVELAQHPEVFQVS